MAAAKVKVSIWTQVAAEPSAATETTWAGGMPRLRLSSPRRPAAPAGGRQKPSEVMPACGLLTGPLEGKSSHFFVREKRERVAPVCLSRAPPALHPHGPPPGQPGVLTTFRATPRRLPRHRGPNTRRHYRARLFTQRTEEERTLCFLSGETANRPPPFQLLCPHVHIRRHSGGPARSCFALRTDPLPADALGRGRILN